MDSPLVYAIPGFLALLALEAFVAHRRGARLFEARDTAASLTLGLGNLLLGFAWKGVAFGFFLWLWQLRLLDLGTGALAWAAVLVADDFVYYWRHRCAHEVRFLWASHVVHHSSRYMNLGTALRQTWTGQLSGLLFWAPLPLLGFHPAMILVAQSVSLVYQFWVHTELIGRLGPLEWVLNTPSHHRVHHATNVQYLDRNYAGILIVWDRLFGTFAEEREPPVYGITHNLETRSPLWIAFHEWLALARDWRRAGGWRERLGYALAPPGWAPGGGGSTSRQLRRQLAARGPAEA